MAFNPFDTFRKNSKIMMAALTVFVMFVFVLSYGGGGGNDFFDWVARQFGARDSRGEPLGSIEGKSYYARNLQETRMKRVAANTFMFYAAEKADDEMVKAIDNEIRSKSIKNADAV